MQPGNADYARAQDRQGSQGGGNRLARESAVSGNRDDRQKIGGGICLMRECRFLLHVRGNRKLKEIRTKGELHPALGNEAKNGRQLNKRFWPL